MDLVDLQDYMALIPKEHAEWCYGQKWRGQDLSWVTGKIGAVKRE
jgi:hypothetical protein